MVAISTNILVYAHRREARVGEAAYALLAAPAGRDRPWAIPWPCRDEFLCVVTNRKIWKEKAAAPVRAWRQLKAWVASPSNSLISETDGFMEILGKFAGHPHVVGGVVHDTRIAAICVAHGIDVLLTCDRHFSLFPELRTKNPFTADP